MQLSSAALQRCVDEGKVGASLLERNSSGVDPVRPGGKEYGTVRRCRAGRGEVGADPLAFLQLAFNSLQAATATVETGCGATPILLLVRENCLELFDTAAEVGDLVLVGCLVFRSLFSFSFAARSVPLYLGSSGLQIGSEGLVLGLDCVDTLDEQAVRKG